MKKLIVALIAALAGFGPLCAETASSYIQTGLIAQYDAIENAGTGQHSDTPSVWKDLVGNHDLTIVGSPTFDAYEVKLTDGAQSFYNDSCSDFVSAINNDAFTIEIRYTPRSIGDADALFAIGTDSNWATRYLLIYAWAGNVYDGIMYRVKAGTSSGCPAVAVGTEHTMSLVVSGGKATLYQDGVSKVSLSSGGVNAANNTFALGDKDHPSFKSLQMDIGSVRIYNTALTAEQIATNLDVDRTRFIYAKTPRAVVSSSVTTTCDPVPGDYELPCTCTAKSMGRDAEGLAYRCTGYSLATYNATTGGWTEEVQHPGELSCTIPEEATATTRVTWLWERASDFDTATSYTYRSITIDNAEALAKGEATQAELSFGADAFSRAAGSVDKLYVAYGATNYRGDDVTRYDRVAYVADVAVETTSGTYSLPAGFGTDYTRFRFFFQTSGSTPSSAYVSDALISQYDAIDNAGRATHVDSPTVWKDLVGGHDLSLEGTPTFGATSVSVTGNKQRLYNESCSDFVSAIGDGAFTLEIHYTPQSSTDGDTLFTIGTPNLSQRYLMIYAWFGNIYDGIMYRTSGSSSSKCYIAVGTKHTMSLVVKDSTAYLYLDGVLQRSVGSGGVNAANNTFALGDTATLTSLLMDICSVRAYAKALTTDEMRENMRVDSSRYSGSTELSSYVSFSPVVVSDGSTATWMYDAKTKVLTTLSGWEFETDGNAEGLTLTSLKTVGTSGTLDFSGIPAAGTPHIAAFGPSLLYNKSEPEKVIMPDSDIYIYADAFRRCTNLKSVSFPEASVTIDNAAFYECSSLEDVSFKSFPNVINSAGFGRTKNAPYGRFTYPATNTEWVALVNSFNPTSWEDSSQEYKDAYNATFTDGLTPMGWGMYHPQPKETTHQVYKWFVPIAAEVKESSLCILGTPVECGTVSPAYGEVVKTFPVTCTAPEFADYEDALYECLGYKLGKLEGSQIVYGDLVEELEVEFDPEEVGSYYIQWQWAAKVAYPIALTSGTGVTISIDEDPYKGNTGYYAAGEEVTVRAVGPNGELPVRWYVDGVAGHDGEATIKVTPSKKMAVQAYIALDWTYENNVLTDGYWTFNASGEASAITIGELTARTTDVDILDFRKTVHVGETTGTLVAMGDNSCWKNEASTVREVYFPESVTSIGKNAFRGLGKLDSVVMSQNLKSIGREAFRDCSLRTVTPFLPDDITLGEYAFHNAWNLTGDLVIKTTKEMVLPWGGSSDDGVFSCTQITSVDFSQSKITVVGKNCFRSCSNLGDVSFPKALTNIESAVFYGSLNKLTNIVFRSFPKDGFVYDMFSNDEGSYKRRIVYPAGNADWEKFIDDRRTSSKFVTWDDATVEQKADYTSSFGSKKPLPVCSLIFWEGSGYCKTRFWMVPKASSGLVLSIR